MTASRLWLLLLLAALPAQAQPLADVAAASLAARFPAEAHRLTVRIDRADDVLLALDAPHMVWPAGADVPRGRVQVRVQDATGQTAGAAMLYVAHFDTVVVATETLSAGDAACGALVPVWRETTRQRSPALTARDLDALGGDCYATRYLREGSVVRPGDVRPPYAVEPGEAVLLRYERGGVVFTLSTEAREAGHVGDTVRLYLSDTRTTYRARLTAPGEAAWVETL